MLSALDRSGEGVIWVAPQLGALDPRQLRREGGRGRAASSSTRSRSYVLMANHQSVFDTAAIVATLPITFRFVAKRELSWIPFFGWALVAGGHVIIDRATTRARCAASSAPRRGSAAGRRS